MSTAMHDSRKYRHPAFDGLSDTQINAVYNIGNARTLAAGETLVAPNGKARRHVLVLKGSLELRVMSSAGPVMTGVLEQGDLLAAAPAAAYGEVELGAVAREALAVLEFDESELSRLPENLQAVLYRNLHRLAAERLRHLTLNRLEQIRHYAGLTGELGNLLADRTRPYEESPTIRELLSKVPRLPPYATKLTLLLQNDNVSTRDVVELARLDPSLTGMVLKTVNSAYYGLSHKVSNFQHAALLLGFNQIHQIIINAGLRNTMPKTAEFLQLQFHSVMISALSFEICQVAGLRNGPLVGTLGLLHDIGRSVILLLQKQNPKLAFFLGLLDHAKIGAMLLREWQIPGEICDSLEYQSYPELVPPQAVPEEYRHNVAVLYLAHLCFDYLWDEKNRTPATFAMDYLRQLKLNGRTVAAFVEQSLLPSMLRRLNTFPQSVQNFLTRKRGHLLLSPDQIGPDRMRM